MTTTLESLGVNCGLPPLEIKKPAGKWEKVSSESYSKIEADPETGMPGGLGLGTISGLSLLMQSNKDRQMMARIGGMKG